MIGWSSDVLYYWHYPWLFLLWSETFRWLIFSWDRRLLSNRNLLFLCSGHCTLEDTCTYALTLLREWVLGTNLAFGRPFFAVWGNSCHCLVFVVLLVDRRRWLCVRTAPNRKPTQTTSDGFYCDLTSCRLGNGILFWTSWTLQMRLTGVRSFCFPAYFWLPLSLFDEWIPK